MFPNVRELKVIHEFWLSFLKKKIDAGAAMLDDCGSLLTLPAVDTIYTWVLTLIAIRAPIRGLYFPHLILHWGYCKNKKHSN